MRFRRSKKLGPLRINLSKSGIGASVGIKGLRTGISSSKGAYTSYGIPGTGIYDVKYHGKDKVNSDKNNSDIENYGEIEETSFAEKVLMTSAEVLSFNFSGDFEHIKNLINKEVNTLGCWLFFISIFLFFINPILSILIFIGYIISQFTYMNSDNYHNYTAMQLIIQKFEYKKYDEILEIIEKEKFLSEYNKNLIRRYCYYKQNNLEKVYELLKNCKTTDDKLKIIELGYKLKKYQDVIDVIQTLEPEIMQSASMITILGDCYLKLDKMDVALEVLVNTDGTPIKKRKMNSEIALFRYILANIYEKRNETKKAITQYNKIFAYNEKFLDVKEKLETITDEKE